MTALLTAIGSGFSAKKILEYLMKKSPDLAPRISTALASGLSAEKILSFFSKEPNFEKLKSSMESDYPMENNANPLVQGQNIRGKNLGQDFASSLQRKAPGALAAAGGAGLSMALTHSLPNLLKGPIQEKIEKTQETPLQPPVSPTIPQQPQITQPQAITSNVSEIINKHGLAKHIEELSKNVQDPKAIAAILYNKFPKEMSKFQKETGKPMEDAIAEYMQSNVKPLDIAEEVQQPAAQTSISEEKSAIQEKISPEIEKTEEKSIKIEKGSTVASPQGIGEIKEIRNGKAIIEVDGKKHQVEEAKLLKPPKEAAIEALELIKGFTPEEMRSTHHMLNSYDEEEKKAFFVFHNGDAYVVDDISPDEYKELSEEVEKAKTTGETIIGKWAAGGGSRGAGYNKIVKGVRERKVVPELKKKFRKLKVGYNLLAEWQRLLNEK